jgi:hypothetical protein
VGEDFGGHHLVHENAAMLRVILKLDDVIVAVVGFQQMLLGATPHLADELDGVYAHAICRKEEMCRVPVRRNMPEETKPDAASAKEAAAKNRDEVALEMMKFIAVTTGYGKGNTTAAGFSGKPSKSSEEYADALIQLFEKCRGVVAKPVPEA